MIARRGRRGFLRLLAGLASLPAALRCARAQVAAIDPRVQALVKGAPLRRGRVHLELPVLAENGNAVPLRLKVESPMTEADHVTVIHLVSERNPVAHMAAFHVGARAGRAEIATRVRLAGSQNVYALAQMSDGSFWVDSMRVQVTLSACQDES
ncbi:MAG: sulfur oxidation protein SoxY [Burkholderiales bacterium]|nr:sulfur oxidation protein SoxY [Burkholderiales bacterium]